MELADADSMSFQGNPLRKVLSGNNLESELLVVTEVGFGSHRPVMRSDVFNIPVSETLGQCAYIRPAKNNPNILILFTKLDLQPQKNDNELTPENLMLLRYALASSHVCFVNLNIQANDPNSPFSDDQLQKRMKTFIEQTEYAAKQIQEYINLSQFFFFTYCSNDPKKRLAVRDMATKGLVLAFQPNTHPEEN